MRRCFFDTSAYVALTDGSDQHHGRVVEQARAISAVRLPRVTTNYILAESFTRIRRKLGHEAAVRFGDGIRRDATTGGLRITYADEALDRAAWDIFRKYADQPFSFVDCVSFAWLREHPDAEVVACDRHFEWMGFIPFRT